MLPAPFLGLGSPQYWEKLGWRRLPWLPQSRVTQFGEGMGDIALLLLSLLGDGCSLLHSLDQGPGSREQFGRSVPPGLLSWTGPVGEGCSCCCLGNRRGLWLTVSSSLFLEIGSGAEEATPCLFPRYWVGEGVASLFLPLQSPWGPAGVE